MCRRDLCISADLMTYHNKINVRSQNWSKCINPYDGKKSNSVPDKAWYSQLVNHAITRDVASNNHRQF